MTAAAYAQANASLGGTVTDVNGGVVPGATVKCTNEATGEVRTTTTLTDGTYLIPALSAAKYTVTITGANFEPLTRKSVEVLVGQRLALDLILRKTYGKLVSIHRGFYDSVPIQSVAAEKKTVDVAKYYNTERLRPIYDFDGAPLFIMTSD